MATCFVVMGFKQKTDLGTGRILDLDATYKYLIKPVVLAHGLTCLRADEIPHSGVIDVPMYEQLLDADLVIADVSTANPNALYELGVRHALKPRATIMMAESGFNYPFDLNHILTLTYKHLGEDIGAGEVDRFRPLLAKAIEAWQTEVAADPAAAMMKPDSPVYTFLKELRPPSRATGGMAPGIGLGGIGAAVGVLAAASTPVSGTSTETLAMMTDEAERAIADSRFQDAKRLLGKALERPRSAAAGPTADTQVAGTPVSTADPYLIQRMALATYKARQPDEITALHEALEWLAPLNLKETNDPETLGIAGAIEKRLFEKGQGLPHLDRAIRYYQRGYVLKDDYYNGINVAFLLDQRAGTNASPSAAEKIADHVTAGRIRRHVLELCGTAIADLQRKREALAGLPVDDPKLTVVDNQLYWVLATQAEAYFGLGELSRSLQSREAAAKFECPLDCAARYEALNVEASRLLRPKWMVEATDMQIKKLGELLTANLELFRKLE